MAGISGQPDYPARTEMSGPKIRPGYWVTPTLVLSRFSEIFEGGVDYPAPWPEYPTPYLGNAEFGP
jgi:hypothetical protein